MKNATFRHKFIPKTLDLKRDFCKKYSLLGIPSPLSCREFCEGQEGTNDLSKIFLKKTHYSGLLFTQIGAKTPRQILNIYKWGLRETWVNDIMVVGGRQAGSSSTYLNPVSDIIFYLIKFRLYLWGFW